MTTKKITLDIWNPNDIHVRVNQGEVDSRFLQIKIEDKGKAFNLTGKTVVFYARKPDYNLIFNNCEILDADDGVVNLAVTSQMSLVPGNMRPCEVHILEGSESKLKIKGLTLEIARCTDFDSAIESTSEFTALQKALDEVKDLLEQYSDENIMEKIKSMDGEGSGLDADLLDGKHGNAYATAEQGAKADTAIQGVKLNSEPLSPDSNKIIDISIEQLNAVPTTRKINSKALSDDIELTSEDVGAASNNHTHTAQEIGAAEAEHTHDFEEIEAKPTTLEGYGITNAASNNHTHTAQEIGAAEAEHTHKFEDIEAKPTTLEGYGITNAASNNHTHTAQEVEAASSADVGDISDLVTLSDTIVGAINETYLVTHPISIGGTGATTAEQALTNLGAVPNSRTVNNKALSSDITLSASDVGAAANNHTHTAQEVGAASSANMGDVADLVTLSETVVGAINEAYTMVQPILFGGTGATTAVQALSNLGGAKSADVGDVSDLVTLSGTIVGAINETYTVTHPISIGGTGATTASAALANLGGLSASDIIITRLGGSSEGGVRIGSVQAGGYTTHYFSMPYTMDEIILIGVPTIYFQGNYSNTGSGGASSPLLLMGYRWNPSWSDKKNFAVQLYNPASQTVYFRTDVCYVDIAYILK